MVNRARTYIIIAASVLFASCQKDLCMDHHHDGMTLRVEFDWSAASPSPASVQSMTLLLYPEDGGSPLRFPFSNIQGGVINVTSGSYRALCVNESDLLHLVNADDWETVSVITSETEIISRSLFNNTRVGVPRSEGSEDERVLREPQLLYSDTCTTLYIEAAVEKEQVLRMKPVMQLSVMHVRVENVDNLLYLQSQSGAVSGLAASFNLTSLKPSEEHCTMPVQLHVTDDGALEGDLYYFGHCPTSEHPHSLMVYTMLIDTSKQANEYDVTQQLHPGDPGGGGGGDPEKDVDVIIPSLPLPTPQPAEGGFDLVLDEWTTQSINIKM